MWEFPVDQGLVLARPDVHGLFLLNSSAHFIWNTLARGSSSDEIATCLSTHFGISPNLARHDVKATIASWRQGLLAPRAPRARLLSDVTFEAEACPLDCLIHQRSFRVLLELGEVWDEIAPRLEPFRLDGAHPEHMFAVGTSSGRVFVMRDGISIGNEENAAGARAILLQALASNTEPISILHAGGCGGVLLAGESHSGKTTLCAALMSRGLPYHCDDSAVLDREFRVIPMPFPLMLREGSWPLLESRFPDLMRAPVHHRWGTNVRFLTPTPAPAACDVKALVFVKHDAGVETQLTELSVLDSLIALQRSGFWVEHKQASIGRFLGWLAGIRRYKLEYADLQSVEQIVSDLSTTARKESSA